MHQEYNPHNLLLTSPGQARTLTQFKTLSRPWSELVSHICCLPRALFPVPTLDTRLPHGWARCVHWAQSPHGGAHHPPQQGADTGHGDQVQEILPGPLLTLLGRVLGQMFLSRCPWRRVLPVTYVGSLSPQPALGSQQAPRPPHSRTVFPRIRNISSNLKQLATIFLVFY